MTEVDAANSRLLPAMPTEYEMECRLLQEAATMKMDLKAGQARDLGRAALSLLKGESSRSSPTAWRPFETAPKDGRWIIARCNDHSALFYISWGIDRLDTPAWCGQNASYGEGLFLPRGDWAAAPQPSAAAIDALDRAIATNSGLTEAAVLDAVCGAEILPDRPLETLLDAGACKKIARAVYRKISRI